jgi:lysozyme family protein
MQANFDKSLTLVLVHEGGWADNPRDPGGATMKGVTLAVFQRYYGAKRSKADLRAITDEQLKHIYKTGYWDKCKCDDLPLGVDYGVFDAAVNSGPGRAARWLQAAVGAAVDGGIGAHTLELVAAKAPSAIINDMLDRRLRFLRGLGTWSTFGRGWSRRVEGVRRDALAMAGSSAATPAAVPAMDYEVVKSGDRGPWVRKVQEVLGVHADGVFGPLTEKALQAWQSEHGLEPDGIAGRVTFRAMGLSG